MGDAAVCRNREQSGRLGRAPRRLFRKRPRPAAASGRGPGTTSQWNFWRNCAAAMPVAGFVLPSGRRWRRWDRLRFHNLPGRLHTRRQHMVDRQIFAAQQDRVLTQTRRPIGIALARPRPAGCRHRSTCAISSRALQHSARAAAASSLPDIRHRMPGAVVAFFLATRSSCCLLPLIVSHGVV